MDAKDINIIELDNVTKSFGEVNAVVGLSLCVRKGGFVTLLGPSGCGKTTLLRLIAGFEQPTSGRIIIEGEDVTSAPPDKRPTSTVFQKYALFPHLTARDNVAFGLKLLKLPCGEKKLAGGGTKTLYRKLTKEEIRERAERALSVVGLTDCADRNVTTLSGGQQQRVAIARSIVLEPKVLLLDEPMSALDLNMRKEMQEELKRLHSRLGITFLFVTHDCEEAFSMSDTVAVMKEGAVVQVGSPEEIYNKPCNEFVARFVGAANVLGGRAAEGGVECLGITLPCDNELSAGEEVDVLIRPERIAVCDADGSADGKEVRGKIVTSVFKGTYFDTTVECGGVSIVARSDTGRTAGTEVKLTVQGDVHVMRREAR